MEPTNYAFMKKVSTKGNPEMRTNFGRHMAIVITRVNGFCYVNLYNNNPRNSGRCSLGWDEFCELVTMHDVLDKAMSQFDKVSFFLLLLNQIFMMLSQFHPSSQNKFSSTLNYFSF